MDEEEKRQKKGRIYQAAITIVKENFRKIDNILFDCCYLLILAEKIKFADGEELEKLMEECKLEEDDPELFELIAKWKIHFDAINNRNKLDTELSFKQTLFEEKNVMKNIF